MLTPATFACRAAPDDRAVSTLRIFLERVARRNRGRGSSKLRRARSKTAQERTQKTFTDERLHRCDDCEWRGWMIPLESRDAIAAVMNEDLNRVDLESVDSALAIDGRRAS